MYATTNVINFVRKLTHIFLFFIRLLKSNTGLDVDGVILDANYLCDKIVRQFSKL